ncbi:MAG TPA: DinB family protein [Pyrinomonadaceae bacterium]|jgi:hypothetical protein|nr:DinB family protein [Pyrinomonadaceae bacterium]
MMNFTVAKPDQTEYAEYYGRYVSLVPGVDVLEALSRQLDDTLALLGRIDESQAAYRYAPEKWSIRELVGHMIDTERVFAFRALCFARNDASPLPGYDQNHYTSNASFDQYPLGELAAEFEHVRRATILMFKHLDEEAWRRRGTANNSEVSVRALAYIIAGHELHHGEVLRSKYLPHLEAA